MTVIDTGALHRLRYNHRGGADGSRQLSGVIIETRIPGDSWVRFNLDQPSELPQSDAILRTPLLGVPTNSPVKFVIESAPRPSVVTPAGVTVKGRVRTLSAGGAIGNGVLAVAQVEPAWTPQALSPAAPAGGIVLKGRHTGMIAAWPRDPATGPAFTTVPGSGIVPVGQLLRVRWLGTAVAGATIFTPTGTVTTFSGKLHATRRNYAPGSIVITATIGGGPMTIRDTGNGRLVGQKATTNERADGTIDYRTGDFTLTFSADPDNVAVTADYEHDTLYLPLDIDLQWDSKAQ